MAGTDACLDRSHTSAIVSASSRPARRTRDSVVTGADARAIDVATRRCDDPVVPLNPVDEYLDALEEPKRTTLRQLRDGIMELVPHAEQCLAYGAPAFKLHGKTIAGFAAFRNHLSYLPHSGAVLTELQADVAEYETSKGALKFGVDHPLPTPLLRKLIDARLGELGFANDAR